MNAYLQRNYFMLRRLNTVLGIVPIGAFFLMHMLLNSRAGQGPAQYQWVPDTLDQVPFLIFIEVFGILLPILFHALLGVWIATRADLSIAPALRTTYGNIAYILQRLTGYALLALIGVHVWQTWWHHKMLARAGQEYDIYGSMHDLLHNPLWLAVYVAFVLLASYHLGNGIFNFSFKLGLATSAPAMRFSQALGLAIGLACAAMGLFSLWGLTLSPWAR